MTEGSGKRRILPEEPIHRVVAPVSRFLHVEAAGGIVLLTATAVALALANSPLAEGFLSFWKTPVGIQLGGFEMIHPLYHWINDGLMAVFFFVIGLEVKRELVLGELRDPRKAALPVAAAIGGMVVPAGVYLIFQHGQPGERGWGIPMATDIAFVVGCLAILGPRAPLSLRVFLLSLAIVDDIGAILVIAIGYTDSLDWGALVLGFAGLGLLRLLTRLGVRQVGVYVVLGALIWLAFHESGIHATIAGVLLGLLTPSGSYAGEDQLRLAVDRVGEFLHGGGWESESDHRKAIAKLRKVAKETMSPVERLEHGLHPWVAFSIMPLFALANAGVPFELMQLTDPVAIAIAAGLLVGKPVGILVFSFIAVKLGITSLPEGTSWGVILAAGFLAGIGFTMAIFISGLALEGETLEVAKVGVLAASGIAAALGMALLYVLLPKPT